MSQYDEELDEPSNPDDEKDRDDYEQGPMDDGELQGMVEAVLTDCRTYVDTELSPERARATQYYKGELFGNEEDGRSQVVMTEVRDGIGAILPSMLEVFFGSERQVEYIPRSAKQVEMAAQATDYVQYLLTEASRGFMETHSVLKDGLLKKIGFFKWVWDESDEHKAYLFKNVTQTQLEAFHDDENVKVNRVTKTGTVPAGMAPPAEMGTPLPANAPPPAAAPAAPPVGMPSNTPQGAGPPAGPGASLGAPTQPPAPIGTLGAAPVPTGDDAAPGFESVFTVELTLNRKEGRGRIFAVPPEELVFSREARTLEDATCVAHITRKSRSELREMGVTEEELEEHSGDDISLKDNPEEIARRENDNAFGNTNAGAETDVEAGEENDKVLYSEAYVKVDYDGDGIAELRKVCTLGIAYHVISNEPCARRPFAMWCPDPEPHALVGGSWADRLMDIQKWKSMLMRSVNDSLSLSLFPRMGYIEGQVNPTDLLNNEVGAQIRMRAPNALQPIIQPFVGKEAMPIMAYIDEIVTHRTGRSDGATGLDADALQSTDKNAVQASLAASQMQIKLLCRIFAEQCLKPLYKLILQEVIERQPRKQIIRLRGKWVDVDPASWNADMDVTVNVGLGNGWKDTKIATLMQVAAEQKDILTQFGPSNPMVTIAQYRNTLCEIMALNGIKNDTNYFLEVDPHWQPPAPPAPPPSPEMIQAQAEVAISTMKTKRELAIKETELKLQSQQQAHDQMMAEKKLAMDYTVKIYAINAQFHTAYTAQQSDKDASQQQLWLDAQDQAHSQNLDAQAQRHKQTLEAIAQGHQQALDTQGQAADQDLAQQAQDTNDAASTAAPAQGGQ